MCLFQAGTSVTGCKRISNAFTVFNAVTPAAAPGYSVTEIAVDVSITHTFVLTAFPKANVQSVESRLGLLLCHTLLKCLKAETRKSSSCSHTRFSDVISQGHVT